MVVHAPRACSRHPRDPGASADSRSSTVGKSLIHGRCFGALRTVCSTPAGGVASELSRNNSCGRFEVDRRQRTSRTGSSTRVATSTLSTGFERVEDPNLRDGPGVASTSAKRSVVDGLGVSSAPAFESAKISACRAGIARRCQARASSLMYSSVSGAPSIDFAGRRR